MNGFDLPVSGPGPVLDTPASGKTAQAAASSAPLLGRRSPRQTPWGEEGQGVGGVPATGEPGKPPFMDGKPSFMDGLFQCG